MNHRITYRLQSLDRISGKWRRLGMTEFTTPEAALEHQKQVQSKLPKSKIRIVERHVEEVVYYAPNPER